MNLNPIRPLLMTAIAISSAAELSAKKPDAPVTPAKIKAVKWISHRGESADAPENTLPAFQLSQKRKTDGMETDIHLTRDGVLVCSHDSDTKRMCGIPMIIENATFAELRTLHPAGKHRLFADVTLPTFAEALDTMKSDRTFYVEIKGSNPAIIDAMMEAVDKSKVKRKQIVMIAFDAEIVRLFKEKYPKQKALWLTGLDPNRPVHEYFDTLKAIHADGIDADGNQAVFTKPFVDALHDKGYIAAVWTIDNPADCEYFISIGVDAITSNVAARNRELLLFKYGK